MASGEVASVVGVQQAAGVFRDLASGVAMGDDTRAGGGAVAGPPPPPSSPPLTSVQAERLALCLAVRGAGRHWRPGLLTAAVADLPPGQVAATFCDGDDTPTVSLAIGAEAVLASHGRIAARIACLGLGDAWAVRPLVDGRALARVLPHLPRGPLVGEISCHAGLVAARPPRRHRRRLRRVDPHALWGGVCVRGLWRLACRSAWRPVWPPCIPCPCCQRQAQQWGAMSARCGRPGVEEGMPYSAGPSTPFFVFVCCC